MKKIFSIFMAVTFASLVGGTSLSLVASDTVSAGCKDSVMGFPRWYRGLSVDSNDCSINNPDDIQKFLAQIILNCIDIALVAIGYIAFGFVLYGGFQFILSLGSSEKMAAARQTILNASIGLVIAIAAVGIVRKIFGIIPGGDNVGADPSVMLTNILDIIYFAGGAAAVIVIIISGFTMIVSGDKPDSVTKARNGIMFSAIGIAVIIFAKLVTVFITGRF